MPKLYDRTPKYRRKCFRRRNTRLFAFSFRLHGIRQCVGYRRQSHPSLRRRYDTQSGKSSVIGISDSNCSNSA
jgi:hypothetical protein